MFGLIKYVGIVILIALFANFHVAAGLKDKDIPLDLPTITTNPVITTLCAGSKFNVAYVVSNDFDPGNIFSVQLSDEFGNFGIPTVIGTLQSVTSGSILATLPKNLSGGFSFRVRVVGAIPGVIGTDNGENITIYKLPSLNIDGNFNPCSGQVEQYTTNPELNFTYKWSVTGGVIQGNNTGASVFVLWGTDSAGTVQLSKQDGTTGCTDTLVADVSVRFAPETIILTGKYDVCVDEVVEYIPAPGMVAVSGWLCQGGTILYSDASKARVRWNLAGSGWIEMQKTSEYNCIGKDRKTVTVRPTPVAQIIGNNTAFSGKRTLYKAMTESGTACRWQVSGGAMQDSTADSCYVTWGQPGSGQVRLIKYYMTTDCSDTAMLDVTINPGMPLGEIEGKNSVCSGKTEAYSTDTVNNTYIKWYVRGGSIIGADNGFNINVSWVSEGNGEVKYVITEFGSGNRDSLSLSVTINPLPEIIFPELGEICENDEPLSLNMAEPVGGAYTGEGVDMDYFYPGRVGVGQHEITYSYTNQQGCEGTLTRTIIVNPKPEKPVIEQLPIFDWPELRIENYYDDISYQWFYNGVAIEGAISRGLSCQGRKDGNYSVQCMDTNGCKSDLSDGIYVPVEEHSKFEGLKIYPNPAGDFLLLENKTNQLLKKIEIVDLFGYKMLNLNIQVMENLQRLDISKIPNGFYIIKLYISDFVIAEKLIINR